MQLTEHFNLEELTYSSTAKQKGLKNEPNESQIENLKLLCEYILEPIREKIGCPLVISSGYRSEKVNALVGGSKTSQHCFDDQTEILTENGWRNIDTISVNDKVYTYNIDTEIIETKPINELIIRPYKGQMHQIQTQKIDVVCTDEHNLLVKYPRHIYNRKTDEPLSDKLSAYINSLKNENDKFHLEKSKDVFSKRRFFLQAGIKNQETAPYDFDFMKLALAVVADGYFGYKKEKTYITPYVGFHLKKKRKIDYVKNMLEDMNIHYSIRFLKDDTCYFYIGSKIARQLLNIIGPDKNIPEYIFKTTPEKLKELIDVYTFFDGCVDARPNTHCSSICTTNAHNADILQIMCVLSGSRCSISKVLPKLGYIQGKKIKSCKIAYILSITEKSVTRVNEDKYKKVDYDGRVWCVRDDNNTVIIRRNGKVSIQGNCMGQAADIQIFDKKLTNADLFNTIVEMIRSGEIQIGQVIWEFGEVEPNWIHVSLPTSRHRNEILRAKQVYDKHISKFKTVYTRLN